LVQTLRGIFAFAIYDRPRRRLLLARDRYGVKPLFYAELDGEWLFASEIKAIVARRGFVPQLDRQACYDFLGLGYVPEPATGFANVRALPPGSVLTITPEGTRLAGTWTTRALSPIGRFRPTGCSACCATSISRSPTPAWCRCTGSRAPSVSAASSAPSRGTAATRCSEATRASGGPTT